MKRIKGEIRGKFGGLLALLLPVCRVALRIDVLDTIPVNWQLLIGIAVILLWVYYASKSDESSRGNGVVTVCLVLWSVLLTFFTDF